MKLCLDSRWLMVEVTFETAVLALWCSLLLQDLVSTCSSFKFFCDTSGCSHLPLGFGREAWHEGEVSIE